MTGPEKLLVTGLRAHILMGRPGGASMGPVDKICV